ncbi:MAG: hypothetical protein RSB38_04785 [Oscillospiraceae bacterium]
MIFLGRNAFRSKFCGDNTPTSISNIYRTILSDGIFGELFISSNPDYNLSNLQWDFSTILWAKFQNNLLAGNLEVSVQNIESFRIKRRCVEKAKRGKTSDWVTLFEVNIRDENGRIDIEKLKFIRFDRYVATGFDYEYAIIPIMNNVEGNYNLNSITPKFDGVFILTKSQIFNSLFDINTQIARNHPTSTVNTIEGKYPFVVSHSKNNYYSGSVSATFVEVDTRECSLKVKEGYAYRKKLLDFLCDGSPKMLKLYTGEVFLIMVTENPQEDRLQYSDKVTTSFAFTEIGDSESTLDLYENGLIDIDISKVVV